MSGDGPTFRIPAGHPALPGHFPGRPVVPGVLVLEAVLERAGPSALGIRSAKFLSPLAPDEGARVTFAGEGGARFRVTTEAGVEIARGELIMAGP